MLAGIVTRKDLMTFKLSDSSRTLKVEARLRGWVCRRRMQKGRDPDTGVKLSAEAAEKTAKVVANFLNHVAALQQALPEDDPRP